MFQWTWDRLFSAPDALRRREMARLRLDDNRHRPAPAELGPGRQGHLLKLDGSDPFTDGVFGEFGDAVEFQFFHDIAAMRFDGLDTDMK